MFRNVWTSLRRLARQKDGASAVEFALIAPIFILLMFAIIETSLVYIANSSLQVATDRAARMVRTGQVQDANMSQEDFRNLICGNLAAIVPCNNNLQIDVQTFSGYSGASFDNPLTGEGLLNPALNRYQPGDACQVVLVRSFYVWPVITPVLTPFITNMANNSHLLVATAAFRNEPFTSAVHGC